MHLVRLFIIKISPFAKLVFNMHESGHLFTVLVVNSYLNTFIYVPHTIFGKCLVFTE